MDLIFWKLRLAKTTIGSGVRPRIRFQGALEVSFSSPRYAVEALYASLSRDEDAVLAHLRSTLQLEVG
jgi:hypothetical protein